MKDQCQKNIALWEACFSTSRIGSNGAMERWSNLLTVKENSESQKSAVLERFLLEILCGWYPL